MQPRVGEIVGETDGWTVGEPEGWLIIGAREGAELEGDLLGSMVDGVGLLVPVAVGDLVGLAVPLQAATIDGKTHSLEPEYPGSQK